MKTQKLYREDVYLKTGTAVVTGVRKEPQPCLILDRTVFFPEGGGQSSDIGTLDGQPVDYVFEEDGVIYHRMKDEEADWEPWVGREISMQIDWPHRFRNMQRHCGEHILSAAFYDLCGGVNRGFHMGEEHMTIDISLEENPDCTELNDALIRKVEQEANRYIWENAPVTTVYCATRAEAEHYPMRKQLALEEEITLVCVGDPERAAGRVACCGTHPSSAGQVGLIKIYRYEKNKGMFRIYCEAGQDAFDHYCRLGDLVKTLDHKYSAEETTLLEKIELREQKLQETRQELFELRKAYLEEKAQEIIRESATSEASVMVCEFPQFRVDDLLNLCKKIPKECATLFALVSAKELTAVLFCGGKPDCGKIIRQNAGIWNGKGGGRPDCARVMFANRTDLDCFMQYLKQAF